MFAAPSDITRRTFLVQASRGTIALAVISVVACAPAATGSSADASGASSDAGASGGSAGASSSGATDRSAGAPPSQISGGVTWHRANLGFVSAYVLARGGEAVVVDTGVGGSEGAIGDALTAAGLGWDAVGHVILTHRHGDHVGSIDAVLAAAPNASAYAGAEDIPAITTSGALTSVGDGDRVFDLRIVTTPGHTAGHISVLDEVGGTLVAGDALSTSGGRVGDSNPQFTDDMEMALVSIRKLAGLRFETLLVGHGDPILEGASEQVAAFAAAGG
jgi:glyoxylase-like metal-dependent hydrolase (beta-lactamase superfamily II)